MVMMLEKPVVKIGNHTAWSENEVKVILDNFHGTRLNYAQIIKDLKEKCGTDRTAWAIKYKARILGLKRGDTSLNWTQDEVKILRQYYDGTNESIKKIIRSIKEKRNIDRTTLAIRHKATILGLTRNVAKHSDKWTEKQEEELAELVGKFPAQIIAEKLERSLRSVYQKCHRLNLSNHIKNGWYSATDVSEILGVNEHLVVKWIHEKKLKATMEHRSLWKIYVKDLRLFIRTYPTELTGRNVDMVQLVDILCGLIYKVDD